GGPGTANDSKWFVERQHLEYRISRRYFCHCAASWHLLKEASVVVADFFFIPLPPQAPKQLSLTPIFRPLVLVLVVCVFRSCRVSCIALGEEKGQQEDRAA
ncbi:unnamed protein product, partial [Ectocarpus sp. 4 AP-2014]